MILKHINYAWVIKAAIKNPQYYFVVTGTDAYSSEIENLKEKNPDNLIYTGYISDGEIKALYQKCKALIQPSLYEGFGIPPLEALCVGGKAIVSNVSSLPEIYGDDSCIIRTAFLKHPDKILVTRGQDS